MRNRPDILDDLSALRYMPVGITPEDETQTRNGATYPSGKYSVYVVDGNGFDKPGGRFPKSRNLAREVFQYVPSLRTYKVFRGFRPDDESILSIKAHRQGWAGMEHRIYVNLTAADARRIYKTAQKFNQNWLRLAEQKPR